MLQKSSLTMALMDGNQIWASKLIIIFHTLYSKSTHKMCNRTMKEITK